MTAVRWTDAQLDAHMKRRAAPPPAAKADRRPDGALGRMKSGAMNKTEARYAQHLEALRRAGDVLWYRFEGITLLLADRCRLTPDFAVMTAGGELMFYEVKGFWRDDARVKVKVAAEMFPFRFVAVTARRAREGGGWIEEEF